MKRITYMLVLVALSVLLAQPYKASLADSDATAWTGNELAGMCNQGNYNAQNHLWVDCVIAVSNMLEGYREGGKVGYYAAHIEATGKVPKPEQASPGFCVPSNATREQEALVLTKYLADHPEKLNQYVVELLVVAMHRAWPCPKTQK